MSELTIKYKDSNGEISERRISDIRPENKESIDAFCHLRNARRSFKISNIVNISDAQTGKAIENPWKYFGLSHSEDGREILISITAGILPAIKSLKFFSMQTRGFAKRERNHIIKFIKENCDLRMYDDDEVDQWLYKLWVGDVFACRQGDQSEYKYLLKEIPNSLMLKCREIAIALARGSGRKQISQEIIKRIYREFRRGQP